MPGVAARRFRPASLRLRRLPRAAATRLERRASYVDARAFVHAPTETHLHLACHMHLSYVSLRGADERNPLAATAAVRGSPALALPGLQPTLAPSAGRVLRLRAVAEIRDARGAFARRARAVAGAAEEAHGHAHAARGSRAPRFTAVSRAASEEPAVTALRTRLPSRAALGARAPKAQPAASTWVESPRSAARLVVPARSFDAARNGSDATVTAELRHEARAARPPAQIVWRRPARADSAARDLVGGAPAAAARRALEARAAGELASHASVSAASPAPAVSRVAPSLDAAGVERLADDIMKRIEKRARIERERRGL